MIGKMLDNRYELVNFIGKGGMALVYQALDHRTGHSVAVKILRPEFNQDAEFLGRFEREATTASRMSHHNIVNLLDVGQDGDIRYLVMEYVSGRTLKEVIQQKGALAPDVAAQIGIRILSALQHAHKNGIIHRDIKSQNILVNSDGHIKVADFGIARIAGSNTISKTDSVMGSVHYFSPEQAKGEEVTFSSDLYSVGVVLYEMMTGQLPFDGETPVAIALQHISGKAKPMTEINPDISPALERVVEKAMEKRPEMRYQSALDMAKDLQRALQEPQWEETQRERMPQAVENPAINGAAKQKRNPSRRRTLKRFGVLFAAVCVVLFMLVEGSLMIFDRVVNTTEAPYLLDETEESALRLVEKAELHAEISRKSDAVKPAGTVIMQSPEDGIPMKKNETIYLTVSTGPEEQPVPGVTGLPVEEARTELEKYGFTLLVLPDRVLSDLPWDTVIWQSLEGDTPMPSGSVIQVTLSGGKVTLPDLKDMPRADAMLLIQQLKLNLTEIKEIPIDDPGKADHVAAQQYTDGDLNQYQPGDAAMQQTQVTLAVYVSQTLNDDGTEPAQTPATDEPQESDTE